jgi:two-component system response regulator MtrA
MAEGEQLPANLGDCLSGRTTLSGRSTRYQGLTGRYRPGWLTFVGVKPAPVCRIGWPAAVTPKVVKLATISVDELAGGHLPLVVCVSRDPGVRERLARHIGDGGIVLICPDLRALRSLLTMEDPPSVDPVLPLPVGLPDDGDLVVDVWDHQVVWRGAALPLTRLESDLLIHLGTRPVRVWTYERLFGAVWGGAYLGDNSILHSAVKRLRRKLRDTGGLGVETVRGIGYRLTMV